MDPMPTVYEIRDPIHRTILIDEQERVVLDHPWVQRLRHIGQTGFVRVAYPGAVNDRFQHSLGVMHLAGAFFAKLCDDQPGAFACYSSADLAYARRIVRLAGLLHDVGHAPFSHTSEAWFPRIEAVRLPADWYREGHQPADRQACHEDMTLAIVRRLGTEAGVISEDEARDIAAVLSSEVVRSPRLARLGSLVGILRALVSGEMDADRCDYLLRDSHFTGVSYGMYDLPRLIACLRVLDGPDGPELGLDVHGVFALECLLLARYHMFQQVYFHKTPPAFEYYLGQAIESGEVQFALPDVDALLDLRDDSVLSQLHAARAEGLPWSRRILEREPAKLVLRERVGADQPENFLADELVGALRAEGCHVFVRRSVQGFTAIAGAGAGNGRARLLCERRVLGRSIVEPVTRHSELLASFNRPIDLQHTYVLRGDADKARRVMERLQVW